LTVICIVGALLRCWGLGSRSLWLDEFSTWHVSQLGFSESLQWEPELTIPPLYQISLRPLTGGPRPAEWLLRLPAAFCGTALLAAAYWLGAIAAGRAAGVSLAALLACNLLQIEYSREARPYTMLVLGSTLSVGLWYRLVTRARSIDVFGYVIVTTLSFHAHFLTALTIAAEVVWWLAGLRGRGHRVLNTAPAKCLLATIILCVPIVARSAFSPGDVARGIGWIEPPALSRAVAILGEVTFAAPWLLAVLLPAAVLWSLSGLGLLRLGCGRRHPPYGASARPMEGLLLLWLFCAWGGLLVVSWTVTPIMVARYALPAAVPALLIPLVFAHRIHPRAVPVIACVFVLGTGPAWLNAPRDVRPGFRELRDYLAEHVDRQESAAVFALEHPAGSDWAEMERLALEYYPLNDRPVHELFVNEGPDLPPDSILYDPRRLYVIEFRADPGPLIEAAGRETEPFVQEGRPYSRLFFEPYRLLKIAPPGNR